MNHQDKITEEIRRITIGRFDLPTIEQFISKFCALSSDSPPIIDYLLQISIDEGDELELGFFTAASIVDITLSHGKVYFCVYPVTAITSLSITDVGTKSILTIIGEKKFDYNVVKPGAIVGIESYKKCLQRHLNISDISANP